MARRQTVAATILPLLILLADLGSGVADADSPADAAVGLLRPAAEAPGLTTFEVAAAMERLAGGDAVAALAALGGVDGGARAPPEWLARVASPPSLAESLRAIADANPRAATPAALAAVAARPALPPDVERALSSLAQGVAGATVLSRAGEAAAGAELLRASLGAARPALERHSILLRHEVAYASAPLDEPGTRARLAALARASSPEQALAALGLPDAADDPPVVPPLSASLAALYWNLGVPVTMEVRAGLAAADGLDPALHAPLALALAHVVAAVDLQARAFAGLDASHRAALTSPGAALAAGRTAEPTAADLAALAEFGEALDRVDRGSLILAFAHALAAERALLDVPAALRGGFTTRAASGGGVAVGDLVLELGATRDGDAVLRAGRVPTAPAVSLAATRAVADERTGALTAFDDRNGDGAPQPGEILFASPALAHPDRDVLFQDPYGFVVVSGTASTTTTPDLGGRVVAVDVERGLVALPNGSHESSPLDAINSVLSRSPTIGAWPFAHATIRRHVEHANATGRDLPTRLEVVVNPGGDQVLRWDLGGADRYLTNAGGAGDLGAVAVRGDGPARALRENATAAPLPVAVLVDLAGDDVYETTRRDTLAAANMSLALLVDLDGRDAFRFGGSDRGLASAAASGIAVLVSANGTTQYEAGHRAIGYAESGGLAALVDGSGSDAFTSGNESLAASRLGRVAAVLDLDGDDAYASGNLSQAATVGGVAVLLDRAGNDTYVPSRRATAQGFAEPTEPFVAACRVGPAAAPACPRPVGPARLAVLADLAGSDAGACREGRLVSRAVGSAGVERSPVARAYDPAAGVCLDLDAHLPGAPSAPPAPERLAAEVPPTFFASSFGNFTIPGLARLGSLEDDVVPEPFALSVDLRGHDAYGSGAVAVVNATRALDLSPDLGYVAPASLLLDLDGNNRFDANMTGAPRLPGKFGYADGGVALQATLYSARAGPLVNESEAENRTSASNRYENVTTGLGAAEHGGVALLVTEGYANEYAGPAVRPGATTCRLACARTGGLALVLARGGPGDVVHATPGSLGAVEAGPLGGVAVYYRRGGLDRYDGSNESMGVVRRGGGAPDPLERALADALAPAIAERPAVALFLEDGWERDAYARAMERPGLHGMPRGNSRMWQDADTMEAFHAKGSPALVVAMGIDNLDWFLHSRLAPVNAGLARDAGPGLDPRAAYATARDRCAAPGCAVVPREPAALDSRYWGTEPGNGNSTTGPEGIRPLTFALTPFTPLVEVLRMGPSGVDERSLDPPGAVPFVGESFDVVVRARNPPGYADVTAARGEGSAIRRLELTVEGTGPLWTECPVPERADDVNPRACVVAVFDRDLGARENATRLNSTDYRLTWHGSERMPGDASRLTYLPGPYLIAARAYAGRPSGLEASAGGERVDAWNSDADVRRESSDALNHTDDSHGFYGSAYYLRKPLYNGLVVPQETVRLRSVSAARDLEFHGTISEPVRFYLELRKVQPVTPGRPNPVVRVPAEGYYHTESFGTGEPYARRGFDNLTFSWDGRDPATGRYQPLGRYTLEVKAVGKYSNRSPASVLPRTFVHIDHEAPALGVDLRGMSPTGRVTAAEARDGAFNLTVHYDPDELSGEGAPARRVHLWLQEDVLDPADPSVVLQSFPWRYVGNTSTYGLSVERLADGTARYYRNVAFPGSAIPGPPRVYRVAAHVEDMAGNVRVERPEATPPAGPDCSRLDDGSEQCAVFLFDVTPPRTRLAFLDPALDVGRARSGPFVLRVDASETPDLASVQVFVGASNATAPPDFANFTQIPEDAIAPDGSIAWQPDNASLLEHGRVLHFLARGVDRVGNVEGKVDYDVKIEIDRAAPALVGAPVVAASTTGALVAWETDEPSVAVVRVLDSDGREVADVASGRADAPGEYARAHEVRVSGLAPGRTYGLVLEASDLVGNSANVTSANGTVLALRTARAVDVALAPLPPLVARPTIVAWTARVADDPLVTYEVDLSLDGGRTFTVPLTREPLRAFERGGAARTLTLDPAALPETATARVRLRAYPTAFPDAAAVAVTDAFVLDGRAPVTTPVSAPGVGTWTREAARVAFDAVDGATGVAAVEVSRDNLTFHALDEPLIVSGPTAERVWYRARDAAGNVEAARALDVLVDRVAPALAAELEGPESTRARHVALALAAEDLESGVARVIAEDAGGRHELDSTALVAGRAVVLADLGGAEGRITIRVTAIDAAGNAASRDVPVVVDRAPPRIAVRVAERGHTSANLAVEADEPVAVRALVASATGATAPDPLDVLRRSHTLMLRDLRPGLSHTVTVTATDEAGNAATAGLSFHTVADVTPPSAVPALDATPLRDGSVALGWRASFDDVGVDRYEVYRAVAGGLATRLAEARGLAFVDATAEPGAAYAYRVLAVDVGGNRARDGPTAEAASRTAPRLSNLTVDVERSPLAPWRDRATFRVDHHDADGDEPVARVVVAGRAHVMSVEGPAVPGGTRLVAVVDLPAARLGDASRDFHVESSDGLHATRDPIAGERRLPAAVAASGEDASWIAAVRVAPAVGAGALVGALGLALGLARARARRGE